MCRRCPQCGQWFQGKEPLRKHISDDHGDQPISLEITNKTASIPQRPRIQGQETRPSTQMKLPFTMEDIISPDRRIAKVREYRAILPPKRSEKAHPLSSFESEEETISDDPSDSYLGGLQATRSPHEVALAIPGEAMEDQGHECKLPCNWPGSRLVD